MSRFTEIVRKLRVARIELIEENRAKKQRAKRAASSRKKKPRKLVFDSPELEEIFNRMPAECQALIRNGG